MLCHFAFSMGIGNNLWKLPVFLTALPVAVFQSYAFAIPVFLTCFFSLLVPLSMRGIEIKLIK
jgi:hypothetical protein